MRSFRVSICVIVILTLLAPVTPAYGVPPWYGGAQLNSSFDGRGIWAKIFVPSTISVQYGGGHSSWVAAVPGIWLQTGWVATTHTSVPLKYWEYCIDNGTGQCPGSYYLLQPVEPALYGSSEEYEVKYVPSKGQWCAFFGTPMVERKCITYAINSNVELQALTESKDSRNIVDSLSENLKYMDSAGIWRGMINHKFINDYPYFTQVITPEKFRVVRAPNRLYLPSTIKD